MKDQFMRFVLAFVAGFALVTALVVLAQPSNATACSVGGHGVIANNLIQVGFGVNSNNPGIAVRNTAVDCLRVSSVVVADSQNANNMVEVGWYDECGDPTQCVSVCDDGVQTPHVLVIKEVNGTQSCWLNPPHVDPTSGGASTDGNAFSVRNPDKDNKWDYYWHGDLQVSEWNAGFDRGFQFSFTGERHLASDSAWGNQTGLSWMGSAGGWNDWTSTNGSSDIEPDYYYCPYSDTHIASKQTC